MRGTATKLQIDVSGAYSVIAIVGPGADTVLRRMTHIHHFPSGGEIAHVQGHVLERDGGYWVICAQELGHYVWDVAVDRASAFGGGPVGVDLLRRGAVKDIFFRKEILKRPGPLKKHYDVVIIGGGSHGLATAYYLAIHHGITDVAILEKSYIGSGAAGRNTTIIRANYRTPEGAAFYKQSVELYEKLSADLDFNMMFSQHGHFTLAHSDRSLVVQNERAEVNKLLGIESRVIDRQEVKRLCPQIHIGEDVTWPIQGALYHPPGGIIRHDAVVWGYAKQAGRRGAEIHQGVEVTGIEVKDGRVRGVRTNQGDVSCGVVLSATAGWSSPVAALAGVPLPITGSILQAFVTEPVKPSSTRSSSRRRCTEVNGLCAHAALEQRRQLGAPTAFLPPS